MKLGGESAFGPGRAVALGGCEAVGWVEPLRNPSHVAIASMGFAFTVACSSCGKRGRSPPYALGALFVLKYISVGLALFFFAPMRGKPNRFGA